VITVLIANGPTDHVENKHSSINGSLNTLQMLCFDSTNHVLIPIDLFPDSAYDLINYPMADSMNYPLEQGCVEGEGFLSMLRLAITVYRSRRMMM
jgi:hypothetical protein